MVPNNNRPILLLLGSVLVGLAGISAEGLLSADTTKKGERIYEVRGDVNPPKAISAPDPAPDNNQEEHHGKVKFRGTSVLRIVVKSDGTVGDVEVLKSIGTELDSKAIATAKTWKFEPATKKGRPVAVRIAVEIDFKLY